MSSSNPPPSGTVTFLFTDIEGSTALYENYRYEMQDARKSHDEILRSSIESHRGHVFKTVGDAFCAAFSAAREAIEAALAAQRALCAEKWPENVIIKVRIGLHTGVAEESEGDYFGPPVNRVARLMSTGHGGQTLLSDATYNLVRDDLMYIEPDAELLYLGEHRLKDLRHTERIFQLLVPDLPKDFEPLRTHGIITPDEIINLDRRYRRVRYIGGGGFGNVYLVRHEALERNMALKVLGRQYAEDEQFKERFKREAKNAASLNHPNIVQVHDAGEGLFEGQKASYIAMEYVSGGTLEDLIAQQGGPLPPRVATKITLQVAQALEAAHKGEIIHRDIKPQNILITESGEAKVADFGIARAVASSTRLTRTGLLMGTLHYMSPEQANGKRASAQSDLYSLGVVLYQMLTGELPFDAETPAAVMVKHISEPLRPPKEVNPEMPEGINAVCVRLLAKDPGDRYSNASALIDELDGLLRSSAEEAERPLPERSTFTEEERPTVIDRELEKKEEEYLAETTAGEPETPTTVEVPDLRGRTAFQAGNSLANGSLKLGDQDEVASEEVAEGEIIGQNPEPGTRVAAGSSVSITTSSGPSLVEVPNLAGQSISRARGALAHVGLSLGSQEKASNNEVPDGSVIKQNPAAGTKTKRYSSVSVTVSSGPERISVPDLAGQALPRAKEALTKAGLKLGGRDEAPSSTVYMSRVIKQDPAAGTKVKQGSYVSITTSSGPEGARTRNRQPIGQTWQYRQRDEATTTAQDAKTEQQHLRVREVLQATAALFAGVAWVGLSFVLTTLDDVAENSSSVYVALFIIALIGTLGGIVGLHTRQAANYRGLGLAGFLTAFVGIIIVFVAAAGDLATGLRASSEVPGFIDFQYNGPQTDGVGVLGSICTLIGFMLLGVATLRARVLPRWYGWLVIIGPLVSNMAVVIWGAIIPNTTFEQVPRGTYILLEDTFWLSLFLPFGAVWLALAYVLWTQRGVITGQPTLPD